MPYAAATHFARSRADNSAFGMHELFSSSLPKSDQAFQLIAQAEVAQLEAATLSSQTVISGLKQLGSATSELAAAAAAGLVTARVVTSDFDVLASIRHIIQGMAEAKIPAPAWQNFLMDPSAPVDVDSISATIESVLSTIGQYGLAAVELSKLNATQVNGEHLAAILRVTSAARPQVVGWDEALKVAAEALALEGSDPEDALFGML